MKDHLADLVLAGRTPAHSRNIVREYLQARILGGLQRQGEMILLLSLEARPFASSTPSLDIRKS